VTTLDHESANPPPTNSSPAKPTRKKSVLVRWFHPVVALLLIGLTVWGFRHFYLEGRAYPGREIAPPIRGLVIAHASVMAGWLIVFLIQPTLIAIGKKRLHMAFGLFAAAFAVLVFVLGLVMAVYAARVNPPDNMIFGLPTKAFLAVPIFSMILFAGFVGAGVRYRKKPAIHRPMMVSATFAMMAAAISRIDAMSNLYIGTPLEGLYGPFLMTVLVMGLVLVARCAITRSFDRWFAVGFVVLAVASPLIMVVARTGAWDSFASLLVP
jgi:hypothetical protein